MTTVRATKSHGGVPFDQLGTEDLEAVKRGSTRNLGQHIAIVREYGLPCVVSINNFPTDTEAEVELMRELALGAGAETVVVNRGFAQGGGGAVELAEALVAACEEGRTRYQLTPDDTPIKDQVEIATRVYGADGVDCQAQAEKDLARMDQLGFGTMPVCMAKTHLSLTHDPSLLSPPRMAPPRPRRGAERRRGVRRRALRRHAADARSRRDAACMQVDIDEHGADDRVVRGLDGRSMSAIASTSTSGQPRVGTPTSVLAPGRSEARTTCQTADCAS